MTRRTKTRSKRALSAAKLQQREAVFALYRDMGPGRTYERLIEAVRPKYGPISKRSLVNWSQQHNWRALIAEHDKRLTALPPSLDELGPDFNLVEALERIACMALQRALASHVEVRTPQDFKAMVDTAEKAIMLVEKLRQLGRAGSSAEAAAARQVRMNFLMDAMDAKIREFHAAKGHPIPYFDPDASPDDEPSDTGVDPTVH